MVTPLQVLLNGNVYGAMPHTAWRSVSICLMLIHQVHNSHHALQQNTLLQFSTRCM